MTDHPPIIVIGAGGHAKILVAMLIQARAKILAIVDQNPAKHGQEIFGVKIAGDDSFVLKHAPTDIRLVNAVGSHSKTDLKRKVWETFKSKGYQFAQVIHPSAVVFPGVEIGEGVQILAGVVVQPGSRLGVDVMLNTSSIVGHDCRLGDHVHLAPGAILSGDVSVGDRTHVGTGATVIQGLAIGSDCSIGAGSLIVRPIPDGKTTVAAPARGIGI